ncbi:MAG: 4Fe-4S binding protein [Atopobiaceae bacterium]|nr:4Fe-4S binding protein [Atopobiaceae bacterium]
MADALLSLVDELRRATECTCTFGHEGAYQIFTILSDICKRKGHTEDVSLMRDLAPVLESQAICEEGRAIGRAVRQTLEHFAQEIEDHIGKKLCAAGSCRAFQTYHILVSKCIGCGDCLKACEDDAILGKPKFVHVVVQKNCTQCNKCLEVCPAGAVVTAGAQKPKTPPKPIPCKAK